eukprot:TRINITY_DN2478_c0_g1_i8.p1 TRINITY_DN2478_c0_g1~~TRINITY_DN2478_c0_g1_i8.p1  ORF type:complete len:1269 (+),score=245.38 TRINITY_DN2478_c0_g1_i8:55-3861(+)
MMMKLLFLLSLIAVGRCQFGADGAVYLPGRKWSNIGFVYPWTGAVESKTRQLTIEFWNWNERWQSNYQGNVVSIAIDGDDNHYLFNRGSFLHWKGADFFPYERQIDIAYERRWHHYACTVNFDHPTEKVRLYIDGVYQGSPPDSEYFLSGDMPMFAPWSIVLGSDQDGILSGFNPTQNGPGMWDNFRIWSTAFSESEILHTMSHAVTGPQTGLLSAWNFNEMSGHSSQEITTGRPLWAFYFAPTSTDPEILRNHRYAEYKDQITAQWGYSGARCRGGGRTMHVAAGVTTIIEIRDLTSAGSYVLTSLTAGSLKVNATGTAVNVGDVVTSDLMYTGPSWMSETVGTVQTLTFRVGSETQTLSLINSPPLVSRDLTVVIPEDSAVVDGNVAIDGFYDNPKSAETVVFITRMPSKGRLFAQKGAPLTIYVMSHSVPFEITEANSFVVRNGTGGWTSLLFQPEPNDFGIRYTDFDYVVVDKARFNDMDAIKKLTPATVYIQVPPSNDLPVLLSPELNFSTTQHAETLLEYSVADYDGDDVVIELMSLPQHGDLWLTDKVGNKVRKLTKTSAGVNEIEQYASTMVNFSTQYRGSNFTWWAIQALGPPISPQRLGDSTKAWAPSSSDGGCIDRGSGDIFYTEFLHIQFETPVYIKEMYSFENFGVGMVVGLRARDFDTQQWKRLYLGDHTVPVKPDEYLVQKPPGMCGTWFYSNELYVEIDTCNKQGWNEIDAFLLVGTLDPNTGYVPANSSIVYVPDNGFLGSDSFEFKMTDCPGNRFRKSEQFQTHIHVAATPSDSVSVLEAEEGSETPLVLSGNGPWQLTSPPLYGKISALGKSLTKYSTIDFPSAVYRPDEAACTSLGGLYVDEFAIVGGNTLNRPVTYKVRGCKLKKSFPFWVFGIIGAVIVLAGGIGFWFSTKQQRKMAALYNNNRVAEECAEAIAFMRLEEVSYLSQLPNPNKIQTAFLKIIQTLEEYKNYMPSSLLVESESSSTETDEVKSKPSGQGSTIRGSERSNLTANPRRLAHLQVAGLKQKQVTVMAANIVGFRNFNEAKMNDSHSEYLQEVLSRVKLNKGIPEAFSGDRIQVSWNAVTNCTTHRQMAYTSAIEISQHTFEKGFCVQAGCSTSSAGVGNMGVVGMKKFSIIGNCVLLSAGIMRLNKSFETSTLADSKCRLDEGSFVLRVVTRVLVSKAASKPFFVYELADIRERIDAEWMYSLQESADPVVEYLDAKVDNKTVPDLDVTKLEVPLVTKFIFDKLEGDPTYVDPKSSVFDIM